MRNSWGSLVFALGFGGLALASAMAGCGADGSRPMAGTEAEVDASSVPGGGGTHDGGGSDGSTATIPVTCSNTIKDKAETDVDCGGGACLPCIDGQACKGDTDCLGANCVPGGTCATPQCTNSQIDTGETDVDCGGTTCRRCTTGKRCAVGTDCVSGACNNNQCACPKGMTVVALKNANSYCVDEIEVSKYQYNQFLKAGVLFENQIDACKPPVNVTFNPRRSWPPNESPPGDQGPGSPFAAGAGQSFNYALPVHYVDWCDAAGYCKWAKKQLCGSTTGGAADFTMAAAAASDAWYNACSNGGDQLYPYSALDFDGTRCNTGQGVGTASDPVHAGPLSIPMRSGYGDARNQDEGVLATTNGDITGNYTTILGAACGGGFTGLYHMTGNVAEWEDSCDASGTCRIRGGSFLSGSTNAQGLRCDDLSRTQARVAADADRETLRDVGIRCCLF